VEVLDTSIEGMESFVVVIGCWDCKFAARLNKADEREAGLGK
jgi:hypothetical protein